MPKNEGLRAQLQLDDPNSPANALQTLAKLWGRWREGQAQALEESPTDVPVGGALRMDQVARAVSKEGGNLLREMYSLSRSGLVEDLAKAEVLRQIRNRLNKIPRAMERNPDWWRAMLNKVGGSKPSEIEYLGSGATTDAFKVTGSRPDEVLRFRQRSHAMDETRSPLFEFVKDPSPHSPAAKWIAAHKGPYYPDVSELDVAKLRLPFMAPTVPYVPPDRSVLVTRQRKLQPIAEETPEGRIADVNKWQEGSNAINDISEIAQRYGMDATDVSPTRNMGLYKGQPKIFDLNSVGYDNLPRLVRWMMKNRKSTIKATPLPPEPLRNQTQGEFRLADTLGKLLFEE